MQVTNPAPTVGPSGYEPDMPKYGYLQRPVRGSGGVRRLRTVAIWLCDIGALLMHRMGMGRGLPQFGLRWRAYIWFCATSYRLNERNAGRIP